MNATDETMHPVSYYIRTFGCQMNVADSVDYARILEGLGCVRAESEESGDILVVNTCSVRAKAEERAVSYLGRVIQQRTETKGPGIQTGHRGIAFVGCMATVRGQEILKRFPEVRTIIPARELDTFKERILRAWPELKESSGPDTYPLLRPEEKFERFLPIIRGCINHCTYCIVPSARGDWLVSKPPDEIFDEVEKLLDSGVKSITFLGQNVCAYGLEIKNSTQSGFDFADLLSGIRDRFSDRDVWFKFLTSHPRDVTEYLIDVIASHECFSRHFHLPIQAGDDAVLERMGRGYKSSEYIETIGMIRRKIPEMRLSTDLIVGFPGEDEDAFEHTLDVVRKLRFDQAFTFLYSSRSGTPAEKWADPVPQDVKKQRLQILIGIQNQIALENASSKIGEERTVLIEGPSMRSSEDGMVAGRTREEEVVVLPGTSDDYGRRLNVRLIDAKLRSFIGERTD